MKIVLYPIKAWDNDQAPCNEYYDKQRKVFYRNDWADATIDFNQALNRDEELQGEELIELELKPARRVHNDDIPELCKQEMGEEYRVVKF